MKLFTKLTAVAVLLSSSALAQQNIKIKVAGLTDSTVHLANYFGKNLLYADTAKVDKKGFAVFNKKKHPGGMYAFVYGGKYFDFIVDKEDIYIETTKEDLIGAIKVVKSKENTVFYDYINFIGSKKKIADAAREKMKVGGEEEKKAKEQLKAVDDEVKKYQAELIKNNPDLLVSKILKSSIEIELPEAPKNPDGSLKDTLWAYKYMRAHYFDNVDLCDDRLIRTPFFHPRMESFLKNMVHPIPDSVMVACDWMLDKMLCPGATTKDFFKYTITHLTYTYETSKIMCMDAVFVHLVNRYYATGKVDWLPKDKLAGIVERAKKLEPTLCQKTVPNLSLLDTAGKSWKKLYDVKSDYTVLLFFDPECGHCKKEVPKFVELYNKYKDKSIQVYAVTSDHDDKWRKSIRDFHMENFINVGVPAEIYKQDGQKTAHEYVRLGYTDYTSLNFRDYFDIYAFPKIYLLDKNKKIIAKQVEAEQMQEILDFHLKKK